MRAENLCHQAILINHASGAVTPPDTEAAQVGDAIWQRAKRIWPPSSSSANSAVRSPRTAARFIRNDRLADALPLQAYAALTASPGTRAFYDELRDRGIEHNDALRRLANRLVGILHRGLKTCTLYDEATAWSHREKILQSAIVG